MLIVCSRLQMWFVWSKTVKRMCAYSRRAFKQTDEARGRWMPLGIYIHIVTVDCTLGMAALGSLGRPCFGRSSGDIGGPVWSRTPSKRGGPEGVRRTCQHGLTPSSYRSAGEEGTEIQGWSRIHVLVWSMEDSGKRKCTCNRAL